MMQATIERWIEWCNNYNFQFIKQVWKDEPIVAQDLQKRFDSMYRADVSRASMMMPFYESLTQDQREKLLGWVFTEK